MRAYCAPLVHTHTPDTPSLNSKSICRWPTAAISHSSSSHLCEVCRLSTTQKHLKWKRKIHQANVEPYQKCFHLLKATQIPIKHKIYEAVKLSTPSTCCVCIAQTISWILVVRTFTCRFRWFQNKKKDNKRWILSTVLSYMVPNGDSKSNGQALQLFLQRMMRKCVCVFIDAFYLIDFEP